MITLQDKDRKWLQEFNVCLWGDTHSIFGRSYKFSKKEINKIESLIKKHELPCVLSSGPLGDLSLHIFNHSAGVGIEPERLLAIHQNHLELPTGFDNWGIRFEYFSKFTHTDRNRELAGFYKLPIPGPESSYEY